MKNYFKGLFVLAFALMIFIPMSVFAKEKLEAPTISDMKQSGASEDGVDFKIAYSQSVKDAKAYYESIDAFEPLRITLEVNINEKGWEEESAYLANPDWLDEEKSFSWQSEEKLDETYIQMRIKITDNGGNYESSEWSNVISMNAEKWKKEEVTAIPSDDGIIDDNETITTTGDEVKVCMLGLSLCCTTFLGLSICIWILIALLIILLIIIFCVLKGKKEKEEQSVQQ